MQEIRRLRHEQELHSAQVAVSQTAAANQHQSRNPVLLAELRGLRQRRDELEKRMSNLQASRTDLMSQLEALMNLLRVSFCRSTKR